MFRMQAMSEREWIEQVIERGNQPIWKERDTVALSEGLASKVRTRSKPGSSPRSQKSFWPCDFCGIKHPAYASKRGAPIKAFCPSLGACVYSQRALVMHQPPNRGGPPMVSSTRREGW